MNDLITIKTGLTNIGSDFAAVLAEYAALEQTLNNVGTLLGDTSLWQADSQTTSAELHGLLKQYVDAIRPIYETLKTCIIELDANTDRFAGVSRNVAKLW